MTGYENDLFPASLPPWNQRADGTWERTWNVTFKIAPSDAVLARLPDLSEPGLQVRIAPSLEAVIQVTTAVTHEPLSDDHFVWAPRRTLKRLEELLGAMETINGQPREWWGMLTSPPAK